MFTEVDALHLIYRAAETVTPATATVPDHTIVVALLGVVGAVATAVITGWLGTRGERERKRETVAPDVARRLAELEWDAAHAENERRDAQQDADDKAAHIRALERALILRGFAPWRFTTGEESDDEARLPRRR